MITTIVNNENDNLYINTNKNTNNIGGRFINYIIENDSQTDQLTIIFIHGGGGNKNQWRNQWRHLAGHGHRLIAWDAFGHGRSQQTRDWNSYQGSLLVEDFLAIFDRFASHQVILVGHSYGTRIALAALGALQRQGGLERIKAAVLLAPPSPSEPLKRGLLALPSFILEWLRPKLAAHFRQLAWHPEADPALVDHEEEQTRGNSLFMVKATLSQAIQLEPIELATLSIPIEIVAGDADRLTPPIQATALQSQLPQAELQLFEHCGHQIMLEQPEATNALLDRVILRHVHL